MKYLSLFSGIGGFELGIQLAYETNNNKQTSSIEQNREGGNRDIDVRSILFHGGSKPPLCIGYSEIDKYAIQIYQKQFPNHKAYGDITKIKPETLPDFELLVGGFPCQAFSIAGKRGGFNDTRGTMFFEIARIIREKQPRLLLLENVKGLLSHDNGATFLTILATLNELGYEYQWQVINSKNHGVPQNRERVFIIGHLRGTPRPQIFPFTGGDNEAKGISVVGDLNDKKWSRFNESSRRVYDVNGISPTIPTVAGGGHMPKIVRPVLTPDRPEKRQNGRRFKENGDPSFTITAQDRHGIYDGAKIRRLTPIECERLQGFPDEWTKEGIIDCDLLKSHTDLNECVACGGTGKYPIGISDTQRYKTLGNAVTVNVVRAIIKKL